MKIKTIVIWIIVLSTAMVMTALMRYNFNNNIFSYDFANPHQIGELNLYGDDDIKFKFYKPVKDIEQSKISQSMKQKINSNPLVGLSKKYSKSILVAEHKDELTNKIKQHIQIKYSFDDNKFIIFSAYEVNKFNIKLYEHDIWENEINVYNCGDNEIIQIKLSEKKGSLGYAYYIYDDINKKITLMNTAVNEILSYKNGVLYHIGYNVDIGDEKMLESVNRFKEEILDNEQI